MIAQSNAIAEITAALGRAVDFGILSLVIAEDGVYLNGYYGAKTRNVHQHRDLGCFIAVRNGVSGCRTQVSFTR